MRYGDTNGNDSGFLVYLRLVFTQHEYVGNEESTMKKEALPLAMLAAILAISAGQVSAETITYQPSPTDLWDLDHNYYYTWGIDTSDIAGMEIYEIELVIDNIDNWDNNENVLFLHLLDDATVGTEREYDNELEFLDAFEGQGLLIDEYHDTGGSGTPEDLTYSFLALGILPTAIEFAADGVIALGADPDCHFYNCGVSLVVTVDVLPVENKSWGQIRKVFASD